MEKKRCEWLSPYGAWLKLQKGESVEGFKGYACITEIPDTTFHPAFLIRTTPKMFEEFLSHDMFRLLEGEDGER